MRQIFFRGKDIEWGEWYYGCYSEVGGCHGILVAGLDSRTIERKWIDVMGDTIGQYTGLKDKNDKLIFEGDILKVVWDLNETIHVVKWMGATDYPAFDLKPGLDLECNGLSHCVCSDAKIEVIGNIHDNPELLEGKK